jgi:hypothetical protein
MSWAAGRDTSRIEDTVYCLMGIFGIHMPLLYGEGEHAFVRLQEEIMKISNDESIFAWEKENITSLNGQRRATCRRENLFATSPSAFAEFSTAYMPSDFGHNSARLDHPRLPYILTNRGLQMSVRLYQLPQSSGALIVLNCLKRAQDSPVRLALLLDRLGSDWVRNDCIELGADTAWGTDMLRLISESPEPDLSTVYIKRIEELED